HDDDVDFFHRGDSLPRTLSRKLFPGNLHGYAPPTQRTYGWARKSGPRRPAAPGASVPRTSVQRNLDVVGLVLVGAPGVLADLPTAASRGVPAWGRDAPGGSSRHAQCGNGPERRETTDDGVGPRSACGERMRRAVSIDCRSHSFRRRSSVE